MSIYLSPFAPLYVQNCGADVIAEPILQPINRLLVSVFLVQI